VLPIKVFDNTKSCNNGHNLLFPVPSIKLGEDTGKAWEILATVALTEQIKKRSNIQLELLSTVTPGTSQAFKIIYQMN